MAIGTTGGKLGCALGPMLGLLAMGISLDWFGFTEDDFGPWYLTVCWLFLGCAIAMIAGLIVRRVANSLLHD